MSEEFPTHRLVEFANFTEAELRRFGGIAQSTLTFAPRQLINREGEPPTQVYLLIDGWVASSIELDEGERQITKIHLPGDILGATSLGLTASVDTLTALTPVTVSSVPATTFGNLLAHWPRLAAVLFLCAQRERLALMERLTALGRMSAVESFAGMVLDLHGRLAAMGRGEENALDLRVTQEQIADYLGISAVHVHRALRQLETSGVISRSGRRIVINDMAQLERLSRRTRRGNAAAGKAWVAAAEAPPSIRGG